MKTRQSVATHYGGLLVFKLKSLFTE